MKSITEVWDFVKDKEYRSNKEYGARLGVLIIDNQYYKEFTKLFEDIDLWEDKVKIYLRGSYFCVYVGEMLDVIIPECADILIERLEKRCEQG